MKKTVAIVGKLADKYDAFKQHQTIWMCNWHTDFDKIPYYDLWFDIHHQPNADLLKKVDPTRLHLRDETVFIRAQKELGGEYINNSMCYMLFYAFLKHFERVKFYGCDLHSDEEIRTHQKLALNIIIAWCKGKGMTIESNRPNLIMEFDRYDI